MYKFQKSGVLQTLMHQLKYGRQQEIGLYFGKELGKALFEQKGFILPDLIVPVPLHWKKEKTRGYNQCQLICEGLSNKLNIPVVSNILFRKVHSESQTKKKRFQRWENVEEIFGINEGSVLIGKHILLIDDIVTTGSTLEACVQTLLQIEGTSISIATIAYA
ncbi:MAG: ComF family protein [Bacteroidetes bacterium]|nr:ComF family protein [Bacteroidota bacterium]